MPRGIIDGNEPNFPVHDVESDEAQSALQSVREELDAQVREWGITNHPPEIWLALLAKQMGHMADDILDHRIHRALIGTYRQELVELTAVAMAALECFDRGDWR